MRVALLVLSIEGVELTLELTSTLREGLTLPLLLLLLLRLGLELMEPLTNTL